MDVTYSRYADFIANLPERAETARETFAHYYARKHGIPEGEWGRFGEDHTVVLRRFMDTMAEFVDSALPRPL